MLSQAYNTQNTNTGIPAMARPLRIEFPGALYHVTSRGDRKEQIYEDRIDRARFIDILGDVVESCNWACHAYCLMGNHYHLIIETPDGHLSRGMRQINGVFSQYSNRRHNRVGHLFQGRYKAILVDKQSYLLEQAGMSCSTQCAPVGSSIRRIGPGAAIRPCSTGNMGPRG